MGPAAYHLPIEGSATPGQIRERLEEVEMALSLVSTGCAVLAPTRELPLPGEMFRASEGSSEREKAEQAGTRDNLDAKPLSTLPAKAKPSEPTAAPIRPGTHRKLICRSSALLEQAVQFLGGLLPKPGRGQSRTQACKTCMHPGRPREGTRARARACQGGPKGGKGGVQVP